MNCSNCGAELISDSLFCQECGLDLQEISLWPDKPWLYIWIKPRTTIRAIVDNDPEKYVLLLAALYGINNALGEFSERYFGDSVGIIFVVFGAMVIGSIGGLIGLYLSGEILRWSGSCSVDKHHLRKSVRQ